MTSEIKGFAAGDYNEFPKWSQDHLDFSPVFRNINFSKCFVLQKPNDNAKKIVAITGCDSGLGYSLSLKCYQLGLTVVSGCLDVESEGAKILRNHCHVQGLDVTDTRSVQSFFDKVNTIAKEEGSELHALINNAGVMIFGEFEWYTDRQIIKQVEVNMIGCFKMAKAFLPLLRKHKGRLINITSHCALSNLPALTVYGATKAAIQSWSDGLRVEQAKYGVKVISFIPGSFSSQSNIMASQESHSKEMEESFSSEDRQFYGKYFTDFNSYLVKVSGDKKPLTPLDDEALYKKFTDALLNENPNVHYKHEPWRYFIYYNLFDIAPIRLRDYLIQRFMKFPRFSKNYD